MHTKTLIVSLFLLSCRLLLTAQQAQDSMVKYTPAFAFNDGFFLNFAQVKANNPVPKSKVIATTDYNSPDFFDVILATKKVIFFDNLGVKNEVGIDKIWGYSKNGVLYVNINGIFNRINVVGSISHFIATIKVYNPSYYDPYMFGPSFGGMGYSYRMRPMGSESTEIRQLILDFDNGKAYDYTLENLEILMMKDQDLYTEFSSLSKRKQKQLKFVYLRKYNDKHPLYFPIQKE